MDDLDAVLAVETRVPEAPHWNREIYAELLRESAGPMRRRLFVAEMAGALTGFAVGSVLPEEDGSAGWGEIESVVVAPEQRRRGIGRALCEALVRWCEACGARGVALEVRAGSRGAQELYRQLGFVATGLRPRYYALPVEDAVLMRLEMGRRDHDGAL